MQNALLVVPLVVASFLIALAALMAFGAIGRRRVNRLRLLPDSEQSAAVFLFDGEILIDATPTARQMLDSTPRNGTAWERLAGLLGPDFPGFADRMKELAHLGRIELVSHDGTSVVRADWHENLARITLEAADRPSAGGEIDGHSLLAMNRELETLRASVEHTPYPVWRETREGAIAWCNAAYLDLAENLETPGEVPTWPPAAVFNLDGTDDGEGGRSGAKLRRVAVELPGQATRRWFEVTATPLAGGDRFMAAIPADRLVRAEASLEEFVGTLTRTFASLPIGIAIFDRTRVLAVFNPALVDLTVLPAEFLISKPTLSGFFDKLRAARMMPEPRDYRSWRQQISDIEAAAKNGTFEETWALPTGQTYRVTGRPHPDGAVALLFEDISAETTVARRFRDELDTGQAVLDALPDGVAVFTPGGVLSISNAAYCEIWGNDPSTSLGDITLFDAIERWRAASAPGPVWNHIAAYTSRPGPREAWSAQISLLDGRSLSLRVTPLARGATMISFAPTAGEPAAADRFPPEQERLALPASLEA